MIKIGLSVALAFMLVGCTGRVQTNPLPEQNEVKLPKKYKSKFEVSVDKALIDEFDRYSRLMLINPNFDEYSFINYDEELKINTHHKEHKEMINQASKTNSSLWQKGLETAERSDKKKGEK